MAYVVGVLLIILCLVGVPLANFDGTPMWYVFPSTPLIWDAGSTPHHIGDGIVNLLGPAHGWLYMVFLVNAALLARKARLPLGFAAATLILGTVPVLSFVGERRATARVRAQMAAGHDSDNVTAPA